MRLTTALASLALLAACAPADRGEEADASGAPAVTPADFAGTWNMTTVLVGTDDPVESQMVGTADGATWSLRLAGRDPVPMTVSIVGDSLVGVSAEYESILRPGVMVTVRTAAVRQGDMLTGNLVATYRGEAGEEVVTGTMQGTRVPQ